MSTTEQPDEQPTEHAPPPQYAHDPVWTAPPRPRWIHPQRRVATAAIAAVSGLALLFLGGVAGAAIAHHHDRVVDVRFGPDRDGRMVGPYGNPYGAPMRPFPHKSLPMMPGATPTPSTS